ncbi:hypothetical protein EIN_084210 [Entamoeba invadens IP1]|uniref:hypothetical protein n=1 Tax=Entamoeba invadens IP1 TaxID=370355 RepID=UPI0002C3DFC1|nr:hypothetical protein EIN_084210 [Entamoeba invadens IP1]ELP85259.1 hypothetical protein EIN_084210 [Entamoeba invadens IP1]|eukprot:XP_004184605.1 hypothetical protein EIN_084210 [Entamoeba invadens IP1]
MRVVFILLFTLTLAKYYSIFIQSRNANFNQLMDSIKAKHPKFIPFNATMNVPHIDLYSTDFLDMLQDQMISKMAQTLSRKGKCSLSSTKIESTGGKVFLIIKKSVCLSELADSITSDLSFFRNPNHMNNLCTAKSLALCQQYGEPDVFTYYDPRILLGFDQDYYTEEKVLNFNDFEIATLAYSNEDRNVKSKDVIINVLLRDEWSTL